RLWQGPQQHLSGGRQRIRADGYPSQRPQYRQRADEAAGGLYGWRRPGQYRAAQLGQAMARHVTIKPLTAAAFAPFQHVIETDGAHHYPINAGMTERYHDLARVELAGIDPRPLISIFRGRPYALPLTLQMVERHPLGSQAFYPLSKNPWLVIVAEDEEGQPI